MGLGIVKTCIDDSRGGERSFGDELLGDKVGGTWSTMSP